VGYHVPMVGVLRSITNQINSSNITKGQLNVTLNYLSGIIIN
jgi:hypothetical protein